MKAAVKVNTTVMRWQLRAFDNDGLRLTSVNEMLSLYSHAARCCVTGVLSVWGPSDSCWKGLDGYQSVNRSERERVEVGEPSSRSEDVITVKLVER